MGGEHHGDSVFQHPYVQCLLDIARQQVSDALAKQPESDRWLICVRTYGRAGDPVPLMELKRFVLRAWPKHGSRGSVLDGFIKAGVDTVDKLRKELQDIQAFREKLKGWQCSPQRASLEKLRDETSNE